MKQTRLSFASTAGIAALLGLLCMGQALAGAPEDYTEGTKRYAEGDLIAAMPLLKKAADAGHAGAQATLAIILDQSDSGEEAIAYFRKSATQGNADGQFGLGAMLAAGQGAPKDPAEAQKWILLAAQQGHKLAINELASAYITGGLGFSEAAQQSPEALRWIRAAADNNYLAAMEKLATAYRAGELGLPLDTKLAAQWDAKIAKARGIRQGGRRNKQKEQ